MRSQNKLEQQLCVFGQEQMKVLSESSFGQVEEEKLKGGVGDCRRRGRGRDNSRNKKTKPGNMFLLVLHTSRQSALYFKITIVRKWNKIRMTQGANVSFCLRHSTVFLQPTVSQPIEVQQFGATTADLEETLPVAASSLCSNCGKTCWMKQHHVSREQDDHTAS